jgi:hypothetical protein
MSGNGTKKVVEAAAKAGKGIDWDGLGKLLVSDEARKEFVNLRRAFDDVNQQLQTKFSMVLLLFFSHLQIYINLGSRFLYWCCCDFFLFVDIRASTLS